MTANGGAGGDGGDGTHGQLGGGGRRARRRASTRAARAASGGDGGDGGDGGPGGGGGGGPSACLGSRIVRRSTAFDDNSCTMGAPGRGGKGGKGHSRVALAKMGAPGAAAGANLSIELDLRPTEGAARIIAWPNVTPAS